MLADPNSKDPRITGRTDRTDVPHTAADSHRKASPLGPAAHEAHTVALDPQLKGPRITRKGD